MSPKADDSNGWVPWSQHVLAELKTSKRFRWRPHSLRSGRASPV
jgi:hypothetical protein